MRPRTPPARALSAEEVAAVEAYVRDNISKRLRVCDLAEVVSLSASCFARLFKAATGKTPHAYVTERRIEHAKALIHADDALPLARISMLCGFADQAHFTRAFRRATGQTPSEYCRTYGKPS